MQTAFKIEELVSGYENIKILKGVNLSIEANKITTIIGPNGCGKSTLLKTIGRIIKKEQGKIHILEQDMEKLSTKEIAQKLALLAQSPSAPGELKVEELISYGRYPHRKNVNSLTSKDKEKIEWAMRITDTIDFRDRELSQLSGGQRQRVWLAMALAQETDILLLDEPTTYLDMGHQLDVLKIVKELNEKYGCTVVMVLHDINHAARFSHQLVAMKAGEVICCGTPSEIICPVILREVYHIDAKIIHDEEENYPICYTYESLK